MSTRYQYRALPARVVFELFHGLALMEVRDGYIAQDLDPDELALRVVLAAGFRWVRTDGEWAVFEMPVEGP